MVTSILGILSKKWLTRLPTKYHIANNRNKNLFFHINKISLDKNFFSFSFVPRVRSRPSWAQPRFKRPQPRWWRWPPSKTNPLPEIIEQKHDNELMASQSHGRSRLAWGEFQLSINLLYENSKRSARRKRIILRRRCSDNNGLDKPSEGNQTEEKLDSFK